MRQDVASDDGTQGGWSSQPVWLKVMLGLSLVFVALGVYRCSMELTPPEGPRVVRVERATIDVPDTLFAASVDSIAALATRFVARGIREASDARVVVGQDPEAWAAVKLHVHVTEHEGVSLTGTASSTVGGRRMAVAEAVGTPDRLREMAHEVARDIAGQLGAGPDAASGGE
jgi:hypothetical protein